MRKVAYRWKIKYPEGTSAESPWITDKRNVIEHFFEYKNNDEHSAENPFQNATESTERRAQSPRSYLEKHEVIYLDKRFALPDRQNFFFNELLGFRWKVKAISVTKSRIIWKGNGLRTWGMCTWLQRCESSWVRCCGLLCHQGLFVCEKTASHVPETEWCLNIEWSLCTKVMFIVDMFAWFLFFSPKWCSYVNKFLFSLKKVHDDMVFFFGTGF